MTDLRTWITTAREQRWGILMDLVFAIAWVTLVDLLFRVLEGPDLAYYLLMLAGIVAYFGFVMSLERAVAEDESGE
ncbi:hypothetical protein OB919_12195 [Halobacteria archaeon AArc-curdl1]|uniref:DUF8119 domain-containing protein n=1 Tax=Natronosalvus hydrolyticus TaxID=2979988 RepID=A0AAP3E6Q3_9EURY|nr:hypothetical protein [Halobacteria archaeon AArc-curdl1]